MEPGPVVQTARETAASRLVSCRAAQAGKPLLLRRADVRRRRRRFSLDQCEAGSQQQLLLLRVRRPRRFSLGQLEVGSQQQMRRVDLCRPRVSSGSWCPTVESVPRTAAESSVRRTGWVNHKLTRMIERNHEEADEILDVIEPWYRYRDCGLPDHIVARLLGDTTGHIFTVS